MRPLSERPYAIKSNPKNGQAKQSFRDECDINLIMAKFQKSGAITHYASHAPEYGDHTHVELQDALQVVADAETMFAELPSSIRKKFSNDPGLFLDFVQDEKNSEEMRKLGLKTERRTQDPIREHSDRDKDPVPTPTTQPTETE